MTINLTESSTYDATVTVPEGDDTHSTLASFIQAPIQALMNRTRWLKDIVTRSNTWLTQQFFDTAQNPDMPYIASARTPGECNVTGTPEPTNPWRRFARLPSGLTSLTNVAIYWGNGVEGNVAFALNCYWRPHNQKWRQEDASLPSYACIVTNDAIYLRTKAAGASDWNAWDWDADASTVSGRDVYASAAVRGAQFLFATGSVARVTQLPLGAAFGPVDATELRNTNQVKFDAGLASSALAHGIKWPIPLLPNNTMGTITLTHYIANAGDTFQWYRRRQDPSTHSVTYGAVGAAYTTDGVNQAYGTIPAPSGIQDGDEYELVWKLQDATNVALVNSNKVYALQRAWTQDGPMGGGW